MHGGQKLVALSLLSAVHGYVIPGLTPYSCKSHMSIVRMDAVKSAAETCLEVECDVGTIDELLDVLKGEVSTLSQRTEDIKVTIQQLEALSKEPCVQKEEIENTVKHVSQSKFVDYEGDENSYG